jgi:hypothetical protein
MTDILELIRQAVEVGWPFVLTAIVVALSLYTREQTQARIADLKERIEWLEANCVERDDVPKTIPL